MKNQILKWDNEIEHERKTDWLKKLRAERDKMK